MKKQKHTSRFNPHTLRYERVLVTMRDRVKRISFSVLGGVVLGVVIVIVTLQFMEAPRERSLRREVAQYKRQLRVLGDRVDRAEVVLSDLEERDDVLYRTIFESEPVSEATRRSGIGGVERYEEFDHEGRRPYEAPLRRVEVAGRDIRYGAHQERAYGHDACHHARG